jgi:hypothetical protein
LPSRMWALEGSISMCLKKLSHIKEW